MSRGSRSKNPYDRRDLRPPFERGEMVVPNLNYSYPGWKNREPREIQAVEYDPFYERWTLKIANHQAPTGFTNYNPANFASTHWLKVLLANSSPAFDHPNCRCTTKKVEPMATERTKYFAMKLQEEKLNLNGGFWLADVNQDHEEDVNHYDTTELRDSQHQVRVDVSKIIKEGESYIVCKTVCLIEGEAPRPPIRVTEYQ